ncbi:MAG: histidine phosphatase family protein [Pseudomonadota bacterium]
MVAVTRWWWVRHGPTHVKAFLGWRDVPADLSDHGAIDRLAAYIPHAPIVASDLLRARQTASAIAAGRARLPDEPDLREFNFGDWDGRHFSEIDEEYSRAFWDTPGQIAPPGGESWDAVAARVAACVARLSGGGDLIAVAHIGVIMTQIGRCQGQSAKTAIGHEIDNLSVTRIEVGPKNQRLVAVNHRP